LLRYSRGKSVMPGRGRVIAVTSLSLEARIASGPGVAVICSHASQLVAALEAAIKQGAAGIISFGIAGGLANDLNPGDWVIGSGVQSGADLYPADRRWAQNLLEAIPGAVHAQIVGANAPVAHSLEKGRLHEQTRAVAVDMESHIAARIAAANGIPFAACRAIIDAAYRDLPHAALVGLRPDGKPDLRAISRSLTRQPSQFPAMVCLAMDAWVARSALRDGRRRLGPGLACPYAIATGTTTEAASVYGEPRLRSANS
jgi:adenosylhomocysteine nucleosidase